MIVKGTNQQAVVDFVVHKWTSLKGERLTKELIWKECFQAYLSKFGGTWLELANYRSKRYLPLSFQAIENISAQYAQTAMPNEDFFEVCGRTPDDNNRAAYASALLKYQIMNRKLHGKVHKLLLLGAICGNVPWCIHWRQDTIERPDFEAFGDIQAQAVLDETSPRRFSMPTKTLTLYEGPDIEVGNIFDFVVDRHPDDPTMAFRINRTFKRKVYLDAMNSPAQGVKLYENLDKVQDTTRNLENSDSMQQEMQAQFGLQPTMEVGVDLYQAEGDFFIKDQSGKTRYYKNHIAVVANKDTLLRFEPCPFYHGKPSYQLFKFFEDAGEVYGRGSLENVLDLQDVVNVRMNQLIESNTINCNTQWVYKNDGVIDPNALISMAGGLIETADVNNIKPLTVDPHADLALQEIGFMMAQFNQTTGAQASFTTQNYKKSATEVANEAQADNARDQFMIRHIEQSLIVPMLTMWIQLDQQMMDRPTWVRIMGDSKTGQIYDPTTGEPLPLDIQGLKVDPEIIAGDFDIIVTGSTAQQRSTQEMQATIQLLQLLLSNNMAGIVKMPELAQQIAKLAKIQGAWKWLKSPMEVQAEQQQQAQQQQAAQQAAPGQGPTGPGQAGGPGGPNSPPGQSGFPGVPSLAGGSAAPGPIAPGAPAAPQPQ